MKKYSFWSRLSFGAISVCAFTGFACFAINTYAANLTMSVSPSQGGLTNPVVSTVSVNTDTLINISATPSIGYHFVNWSFTANANITNIYAAFTSVTISGDSTLTANFEKTSHGNLWGWGSNTEGQLGDGTRTNNFNQRCLQNGIVDIETNIYHTFLINTSGELLVTGFNSNGQLGTDFPNGRETFIKISDDVSCISVGWYHSHFIKNDGSLYSTGRNTEGQLGDGTSNERHIPVQIAQNISEVASGSYHSLFIAKDCRLFATGKNDYGQLGLSGQLKYYTPVEIAQNIKTVRCGDNHTLFLTHGKVLMGMGRNTHGQLGDGTRNNRNTPIVIAQNVKAMVCGGNHSLYVTDDGSLYAMGANDYGQIGDGTVNNSFIPVKIADNVKSVDAGSGTSFFITDNNELFAMGNSYTRIPTKIGENVCRISAGGSTYFYIQEVGGVTVDIEPQMALDSGAMWRLDGGGWHQNGETLDNISVGSHTVNFKTITGWDTPTDQIFSLNKNEQKSLNATYTIKSYTLRYINGPNGNVTGTMLQTINHGADSSEVAAVPNIGYHFVNWTGDYTGTSNPLIISDVTVNKTITANFAINAYTVTFLEGVNGTITGTKVQMVNHGSDCTSVTAVPGVNYHFVNWTGDFTGTTNPLTLSNLTANKTITANFAINQYTLTYNADSNGIVTGTNPQTVNYGANGTAVTAVPNTGYHFVNWTGDYSGTQNPLTLTNITANKSVTANFAINTYSLQYAAGSNGTLTGTASQTVNYGSNGTAVTAVPNTGYHFVKWSDDVMSESRTDTNITSNKSVTATFAINTYTVTFVEGMNGTITGTKSQTVNHGAGCTAVTAVPVTNYHFVDWTGDYSGTTNPLTISNVTANKTITANFAHNIATLTVNPNGNGSAEFTGANPLNTATATAILATPDTGYHFVNWTVTSGLATIASQTTASTTVTLNGGHSSAVTITANFAIDQYTLTYTAAANGVVTGTSPQMVNHGSSGTAVTAVARNGYHFTGWSDDVMTVSRTDTNITANLTVAATFAINTYTVTFDLEDKGERTGGGDLSQTINHGGAATAPTVSANAGWTFNGWDNTFGNITSSQTVKAKWIVGPPVITDPGMQKTMVGVPFTLLLAVASESGPVNSVTVTGLPTGLKFDAKTMKITGVPTTATNKTVTVTAKNDCKTPAVLTFSMTVDLLPIWAYGTFNGSCVVNNNSGTATMTVTALGKVTGKLSAGGVNYAFSSASYARRDEDGAFWISTDISVNKADVPLTFKVTNPAGVFPAILSVAEGWLADKAIGEAAVKMYRNVWKDKEVVLAATLEPYIGYYTAVLPGGATFGSGYLAITVDKAGAVKTTGKLADGTVLSLSSTLIIDGNEPACVFTVIYTSPVAYKGGCLFGISEFAKHDNPADGNKIYLRLLDDALFIWENRNPQATGVYGDGGFDRDLGLVGGWYEKTANLYEYYQGKDLTVGADAGAPDPVLNIGVNHYTSDWWNTSGIAITPILSKTEVMTGLTVVPKAGLPVNLGNNNWNYDAEENTVGLKIGLTRPTGIFKGSFKAWFDYDKTHAFRSIPFEGVMIPEREDKEDGNEGRGFYLWADKAPNPQGKTYPFNWSYDFLINATPTVK